MKTTALEILKKELIGKRLISYWDFHNNSKIILRDKPCIADIAIYSEELFQIELDDGEGLDLIMDKEIEYKNFKD